MAFSRETFEELWGLEYAAFDPRATYSLHPIIFPEDDDVPLADRYELGEGTTLRFRELGALVGRAETIVKKSEANGALAGVIITSSSEATTHFAASILVTMAKARRIPLKPNSFVTWLYGPSGSGTAKHKDWWRRAIEPGIAINRMPEPSGYAETAGDMVACVPTKVASKHRPHLPIYRENTPEFLLVNALSSDPDAMRQRLTVSARVAITPMLARADIPA